MLELRTTAGGVVHAHSPRRVDAAAAVSARRGLHDLIRATCGAHPRRLALGAFVRGPTVLAFLAGAAINPRVCRDVQSLRSMTAATGSLTSCRIRPGRTMVLDPPAQAAQWAPNFADLADLEDKILAFIDE